MIEIHLHHLLFRAFHGVYEEERLQGNDFEVNADVQIPVNERISRLAQTVDYADLYAVIRARMQEPTALLETLAQDLAECIHAADERIKFVKVSVKKLAAPIPNFVGTVGVSYVKVF